MQQSACLPPTDFAPVLLFVLEISKTLSAQNLLEFGAVEYRPDQVMKLKPLCEKLAQSGWRPEVSFQNGILQTIAWLTNEPCNELLLKTNQIVTFDLPVRH
jgi:nucleoside-diphosphate-sugar epimerase